MSSKREFRDSYVFGKTIGTGNFSVVKKCRHKFSKNVYAAKIVELTHGNTSAVVVTSEVTMVRKLKHANILSFVDVYYSAEKIIVITELSEHGDLHDFIISQATIREDLSRLFALEISAAINFMHSQNIAHRDIKPENILIFQTKTDKSYTLKLCDFGLAKEVTVHGLTEVCGSPSFVAPEILKLETYGLPIDIWSMGILFYFLLCKYCPFEHEDLKTKFNLIMKTDLFFPPYEWTNISNEAKNLIRRMLEMNPKNRLTASEVMYDAWFRVRARQIHDSEVNGAQKVTFKGAAVAVAMTTMLTTHYTKREDAVVSKELVKKTLNDSTL